MPRFKEDMANKAIIGSKDPYLASLEVHLLLPMILPSLQRVLKYRTRLLTLLVQLDFLILRVMINSVIKLRAILNSHSSSSTGQLAK